MKINILDTPENIKIIIDNNLKDYGKNYSGKIF